MGKNEYVKSTRQSLGIHVNEKGDSGTSNRQMLRLRRIWYEFRTDWIKLNRPSIYKVVIIDTDDKENFEFRTQKYSGNRYLIECDKFSWVDD